MIYYGKQAYRWLHEVRKNSDKNFEALYLIICYVRMRWSSECDILVLLFEFSFIEWKLSDYKSDFLCVLGEIRWGFHGFLHPPAYMQRVILPGIIDQWQLS